MKEFGITKQMIIDQGAKIMKGKQLVNNKGQIVDQKNFNKAMFSLMQERYKGGMDLQSKTLKGTMSTITGVAKNSLAQLMGVAADGTIKTGGLFDKLKGKVNIVANTLQKWSNDGSITKVTKKIERGFTIAGNVVGEAKRIIGFSINWIGGKFQWLNGETGFLKQAFETGWNGIKTAIQTAIPIIKPALDIVINAVKILYSAFKITFPYIKSIVSSVWEFVSPILEKLGGALSWVGDKVSGVAKWIGGKAKIGGGEAKVSVDGSHANGLNRVPFDNYRAELHKDEMVLTKNQAENYRKGGNKSNGVNGTPMINININGVNKSTTEILNELVPQLKLTLANI